MDFNVFVNLFFYYYTEEPAMYICIHVLKEALEKVIIL